MCIHGGCSQAGLSVSCSVLLRVEKKVGVQRKGSGFFIYETCLYGCTICKEGYFSDLLKQNMFILDNFENWDSSSFLLVTSKAPVVVIEIMALLR